MKDSLRKFLTKSVAVALASALYAIWLWKDTELTIIQLAANVLSVVGMVFIVWGLIGLVHNAHALAAFTYSFRYVMHIVRNARNKDDTTNKRVITYAEYVETIEKRDNIPWCFIAGAIFTAISVVLWLISR